MTLDAMQKVVAAEEAAKTSMREASAASKQLIADAEARGRAYETERQTAAKEERKRMMLEAGETARKNQEEIMHHAENQCAVLRAHAESRLSAAADRIVERIVTG